MATDYENYDSGATLAGDGITYALEASGSTAAGVTYVPAEDDVFITGRTTITGGTDYVASWTTNVIFTYTDADGNHTFSGNGAAVGTQTFCSVE